MSTSASATVRVEPALQAPAPHHLEVVRKLVAAMMLGQRHGIEDDVSTIRSVLSRLLDDDRIVRLGLAVASASAGDARLAHALLAEGVLAAREAGIARLAIALALKQAGDPQWRAIVDDTLADARSAA